MLTDLLPSIAKASAILVLIFAVTFVLHATYHVLWTYCFDLLWERELGRWPHAYPKNSLRWLWHCFFD